MVVFFFSSKQKGVSKQIQMTVEALVDSHDFKLCRTVENLSRRLHQKKGDAYIALLLASNREELTSLVSLRSLMSYTRIILIIPDEEEDTVTLAHKLRPNFLATKDNDLQDLSAVLMKMLQVQKQPKDKTI